MTIDLDPKRFPYLDAVLDWSTSILEAADLDHARAELAALIREKQAEALEALADRMPAPGAPPPTWDRFEGILRIEAARIRNTPSNDGPEHE